MNVLFITADQWRAECLSVLGHDVLKTPNLDQLANEGVLFKRHYAQATPCAPSRTSIHTGMYLHNHRCVLNGTPVDAELNNWAMELCRAGYAPSLFGYTDTAVDPRGLDPNDSSLTHYSSPLPGIKNFTPYRDDISIKWLEYLADKGYPTSKDFDRVYGTKTQGVDWADGGDAPLPLAIRAEDHETYFHVDMCIDWIKEQKKQWVTHLSLLRPHPPFVAPAPYNRYYAPDTLGRPSQLDYPDQEALQHPMLDFYLQNADFKAPATERGKQQIKANYYGLISEVDDNLGRLFSYLKSSGQWDSTLIIFTSDHGEQLGDHWLRGKLGYFEASYHIPLIIRDPRSSADKSRGQKIDGFTENVDVMPTLLDSLGLDVPAQCDGHSLMPIVNTGEIPVKWRQEAHWEFDFRSILDESVEQHFELTSHQCSLTVIRDKRYKYVHFTALPPLFFDLQNDPGEFINLAEQAAYQSRLLEFTQKMLSWRMNYTHRGLTEIFLSEDGPITRSSPTQYLA